jgi:5-methylthioadenosine/S-adenosylhomocysteine deaminase
VVPVASQPIIDGAVRVREGRIEWVGSALSLQGTTGPGPPGPGSPERRIDLGEAALLPGLVNVHTHFELALLRGFCEEREFFPWIRRLTEIKYGRLAADPGGVAAFRAAARWGALEAIRAGITTVGDASDRDVVLDVLLESGLRGIAYQEVFGPAPEEAEARLAALEERLEAALERASDRVRVGVSPHAPYTVSAPLFRRVAALASERGLRLCVHAAESPEEGDLVRRGTGPWADHLRGRGIAWKTPGISPVAYLEELGVLAARALIVHAVEIDGEDIARIRAAGASVAHCPKSNAKLGHGVAPLEELRVANVAVGLGTDSVASNNGCDLIEEARFAILAQRARRGARSGAGTFPDRTILDTPALVRLMTLGGAEALGLGSETGSLEPGKLADLVAIDLSSPHHRPVYRPEDAIIFSASGRDVVLTVVGGEVLYERGRVTRLDEAAIREELESAASRLRAP